MLGRSSCRGFVLALEEYLAGHPGPLPFAVPGRLQPHYARCRRCRIRWQAAARSRVLTSSLQACGEPAPDPYFYDRLRARIAALHPARVRAEIRWRHVVLATALFLACLGSFAYDMHQTEVPNADEAMVLDVPHINPQHPADSHLRPRLSDAMLNLMNP